jgi:titin
VQTINLASALPQITDPVVIDGTTQGGFVGTPLIEINGAGGGTSAGLRIQSGNCTVRGLVLNRFAAQAILLQGGGTNTIMGNFIGTDPSGTLGRANGLQGIWVNASSANTIGGTSASARNLISGNGDVGIYVLDCSSNVIQGNYIGIQANGTAALPNISHGVVVSSSGGTAQGNLVGGSSAVARNIISGNGGSGVYLNGAGATGNLVQGNYVGTDVSGSLALPNVGDGVTLSGASGNTIGGATTGAGNVISGNNQGGVSLTGAPNNLVQGNVIGADTSGKLALGNAFSGVTLSGASSNLIGAAASAARNVISANKLAGVFITAGGVGNVVQGNYIGVDTTGGSKLGNLSDGISVNGAGTNVIGGTVTGARNVISGNLNYGIEIFNAGATANVIQGSYIGPGASGQAGLGNSWCGLHVMSSGNTIGGALTGAGNLISGNGLDGIFLDGAGASANVVQGNFIGTTASGTSGQGNGRAGIGVSGAPGNTLGGTTSLARNLISANGDAGIYLIGSGATGNQIQGNIIGANLAGTSALGNTYEGIYIERAPTNTIGGALAGAGNLISGNNTRGIWLTNASWNVIQGNKIGTQSDGISPLGNVFHNVECEVGANNNLIGGGFGAGNTIAFAQSIYAGVRIRDGSTNNGILGNSIFSNGALGIDLSTVGVSQNDYGHCDSDTGANMLQNFPLLSNAVSGVTTGVRGWLDSAPNTSFLLQFFASPAVDGSGYGEGQVYLGDKTVVLGGNCTTNFSATFPTPVPVGYVVTATATDPANNTSEFSAYVPVAPLPRLNCSNAPNHQLTLAWTNTAGGFVLKQTDSLAPPIHWSSVTNIPLVFNNQFTVTVPATNSSRFYLLSFE